MNNNLKNILIGLAVVAPVVPICMYAISRFPLIKSAMALLLSACVVIACAWLLGAAARFEIREYRKRQAKP